MESQVALEPGPFIAGGLGPTEKATPEIQGYCDQVRKDVEEKVGANYCDYVAVSYRSQVVAGTNYFVKIHVGGENYIIVRIFKPLPGSDNLNVSLSGVQEGKTKDSPIEYFE